jgi:ketosteroid isomerase-like protein
VEQLIQKGGLQVSATQSNLRNEVEIRNQIESWAKAVRERDMEGILRNHSSSILMFDVPPPLVSRGIEEYEKTWELFYGSSENPAVFEIRELTVTAGSDVAFATALMRCTVKEKTEEFVDLDFRLTIGLRNIENEWIVTHEHHSIPAT